jgi:beta-galactosidase
MRKNFNEDWLFRANQNEWKKVTLPHDAMLEGQRDADAEGASASGFFHGGRYFYKKIFVLSSENKDKKYTLEFGGVYKQAKISVNGQTVKGKSYGYMPFSVDISEFLKEGENLIEVEAGNEEQPDSRWYSGGGIYRSVYLREQERQYLKVREIRVSTISIYPAVIRVEIGHVGGAVSFEILDAVTKEIVAQGNGDDKTIEIPNAKLWDAQAPNLYELRVSLTANGRILEEESICFGIRQVEKRRDGLYINGRPVLLKGGCIHHDNGVLGAKEYKETAERKIRIEKSSILREALAVIFYY